MKLFLFLLYLNYYVLAKKPNIILILTDDQDLQLGGMTPMYRTKQLLADNGANFVNAFATTPICCPSRSSILTGLYQHNHGVFNNSLNGNCNSISWQSNFEDKTFGNRLKNFGYDTFYAGKYLNQYGSKESGGARHIPLGWDTWVGLIGNSKYFDYHLSVNGKKTYLKHKYLTNVIEQYARNYIMNRIGKSKPFLMVLAPPAPHSPFTPEKKYKGVFSNKTIPWDPSFNYPYNDKKHWFVRMKPAPLANSTIKKLNKAFTKRWETLLSVDDLVNSTIHSLKMINELNNTYIIYTSDHGYHLGQFSMPMDKRQPYDIDIRVPFIVRGPDIKKKTVISSPVALIDIAPTILAMAGMTHNDMDGKNFLSIKKLSRTILVEYHGENNREKENLCYFNENNLTYCSPKVECKCEDSVNNTYTCVRALEIETEMKNDFVYCEFQDSENFEEAYNITKDPYQLENIIDDLSAATKKYYKSMLNLLSVCKGKLCDTNF